MGRKPKSAKAAKPDPAPAKESVKPSEVLAMVPEGPLKRGIAAAIAERDAKEGSAPTWSMSPRWTRRTRRASQVAERGKVMRTIFKYPLEVTDNEQKMLMPEGARVVNVGTQLDGFVYLWALVDSSSRPFSVTTIRTFVIVGTGHPIPDGVEYVGTVQQGPFVWHVLEDPRG